MDNATDLKPRVVVGMSGGVDSSVSAYLLKEQGYEVVGLFMKNWDDSDDPHCPAAQDYEDALRVADRLGIPLYSIEFVQEYRDRVFEELLAGYRAGITPNPDVLCNREIKFKLFADKAREWGAEYLATGHYARLDHSDPTRPRLLKGRDIAKDQSYFLSLVPQEAFRNVLFPLGDLEKTEVRRIAAELGLSTAKKKDSTGICFIGERKFRDFLAQYLKPKPGDFVDLDGNAIGRHQGAHFYTLGQRKGLGLGGEGERYFVVDKDLKSNTVTVVRGADHPALYSKHLKVDDFSWIGDPPDFARDGVKLSAKARYRQPDQTVTAKKSVDGGGLDIEFLNPQRALTVGQTLVLYEGERCLGGGVISWVEPTLRPRNERPEV